MLQGRVKKPACSRRKAFDVNPERKREADSRGGGWGGGVNKAGRIKDKKGGWSGPDGIGRNTGQRRSAVGCPGGDVLVTSYGSRHGT